MGYKNFLLDDRAKEFLVTEKLSCGKALSHALAQLVDPRQGTVSTYLPENVRDDHIYAFDLGCVADYVTVQIDMIDRIHRFLLSEVNKLVVMENSSARRSDPVLNIFTSKLFFDHEYVYHYLTRADARKDRIKECILEASNAWQNVGFLISLPPGIDLRNREDVDDSILRALADRIETMFADAYDLDGYLIWHLEPPPV